MGISVLVIGSGGREHALAVALRRASSVEAIDCAPGNPGTADLGENHHVDASDPDAVAKLAESLGSGLVVVGPEAPLVAGVADELRRREIPVFGPSAGAAQIEGSKAFAKDVMLSAGAPTGRYEQHTDPEAAKAALGGFEAPYVIKADGLAAGKGVRICPDIADAHQAIDASLVDRAFGEAGSSLVIEEFLAGPEASVFAVCDGTDAVLLSPAQDFKRALDGDEGLNTGGMGAFSPVPTFTPDDAAPLEDSIFLPVLREMDKRGTPFRGLLYAGLVLTSDGPKLIEFNARFGDPETQVVVPRIASDFGELLLASATGSVADVHVEWSTDSFVTVVLASGGYPQKYDTGVPITGVEAANAVEGVHVIHAGTAMQDGQLVTAGGRVLSVTAQGTDLTQARERAYEAAAKINFEGKHLRTDIALAAASA